MTTHGRMGRSELIIVAQSLPVERWHSPEGDVRWVLTGGVVTTALRPIMKQYDTWIGWDGEPESKVDPFDHNGLHLVPVPLDAGDIEEFYEGFSNATIWPIYHDLVAKPEFHREWWDAYVSVNHRFAEKAAEIAAKGATVWVHDYQLQLVPQLLRELRPDLRIGFYLHIPFPPAELFQQLPWRRQILEGLLGADLIGFQMPGAAANFVRLVRQRVGHKTHRDTIYLPDGRTVRATAFPTSIDTVELGSIASSVLIKQRATEIREQFGNPRKILLSIDRLDFAQCIQEKLVAFGELVEEGLLSVPETVLIQVTTPAGDRGDSTVRMRDDIQRLVGRINAECGRVGRPAIVYINASLPREELVALYRAADIMLVTPYRDGMNFVAKEYVACRFEDDGALVLSEFAGAAAELRWAWLVNPYDMNGMKSALLEAHGAGDGELTRRMKAMRKTISRHDADAWAGSLGTLLPPSTPISRT